MADEPTYIEDEEEEPINFGPQTEPVIIPPDDEVAPTSDDESESESESEDTSESDKSVDATEDVPDEDDDELDEEEDEFKKSMEISKTIVLIGHAISDIGETLEAIHSGSMSEKEYYAAIRDTRNNASALSAETVAISDDGIGRADDAAMALLNQLKRAREQGTLDKRLKDDDGQIIAGPRTYRHKTDTSTGKKSRPVALSGDDGFEKLRRSSIRSRVQSIPLYHSGFYLDIVEPSPAAISRYTTTCTSYANQLGGMWGAMMTTMANIYLVRAAAEIIRECIAGSNIKGLDSRYRMAIRQYICIQDIPYILMRIAMLMSPNGYPDFVLPCLNSACKHTVRVNIDLDDMIYHNFDVMPKRCKDMFADMKNHNLKVDPEFLSTYRKHLLSGRKFRVGQYEFVMTEPLIVDYINYGDRIMDLVAEEAVQDTPQAIHQAYLNSSRRLFRPWIQRLNVYGSEEVIEGDTPISFSDDTTVIERVLLELVATHYGDTDMQNFREKYIDNNMINLVGVAEQPCPACGHEAKTEYGFQSKDPLEIFFSISWAKLIAPIADS